MGPVPAEEQLTWIFGSSRSGSTWLLRMLAAHPAVQPVDETGIGHHLGVWRPIPLAWATSEEPQELTTFAEVKRDNPDYLFSDEHREGWEPLLRRFVLDRLALQADGRRLVIKEPGGSHMAEWVLRLLPHSGMVFLLRDGRDVVDSWLDAYRPGAWHTEEGGYPLSPEGRIPFIRWQATVWRYRTEACERAYAAHDPARRVLVRYEDLLAATERELARVHAVVGTDASAGDVADAVRRHAYGNVPEAERGTGHHIREACPGGWRERLSTSEQEALLEVLGDKVRALGYA